MSRLWMSFAVAASAASFVACSRAPKEVAPSQAEEPVATTYPRAGWRITPFNELNRTFLWVSHIVVAHDGSKPVVTKLRGRAWTPDPTPVAQRSRAEALKLARRVQELAQTKPDSFASLAAEYSDDVVTKREGGSLGGVAAGQLPSEFLDALAVMRPGDISHIVETAFGFHILKRSAIPVDTQVAGSRIIVAYNNEGERATVHNLRTRDEARARADQVVALARGGERSFESLVAEFSDGIDKAQSGDMGVYSTQDPEFVGREVERLAALKEGDVSEPIDAALGFTVLKRTAVTPRTTYAMRAIQFSFDPAVPNGQAQSRSAAAREAALFSQAINKAPEQFDAIVREQCCDVVVSFEEGRGPVGVVPTLRALKLGEISATAVESPTNAAFLILQRVDPRSAPSTLPPRHELLSAPTPDVEALFRRTDRTSLARSARLLRDQMPQRLHMNGEHRVAFEAAINRLAAALEKEPDVEAIKVELWRGAVNELKGSLSAPEFSRFEAMLNEWVIEKLMENVP